MRINAQDITDLRMLSKVYVDDKYEPETVEVYIPGNVLEGQGHIFRAVRKNGKSIATGDVDKPLPPGQYDSDGLLCEKICGQIRIEIEERPSAFEGN